MELIYISHPFTGNEELNRLDARQITGRLSMRHQDEFIFINPLDLFQGQSDFLEPDSLILKQALEVLRKCNGVVFCKGWQRSAGCRKEFALATKLGLPIWESPELFTENVVWGEDECQKSR